MTDDGGPDISVIIRSFNEEKHIGRLLHGIEEQSFPGRVETVLVDSGSTDATVSIAEHFGARIVRIRPEEFSFGRALNRGCEAARGRRLVLASAHVYPLYDDWLELLTRPFEDERIALVYGRQRGGEETRFAEHQVFAHWYPEESVAVQEHPFCNNANAAIRRSLWEEHPYDEELTGLEDIAWARDMLERGYALSYAAEAEVVHIHEETPRQIMRRYMREAIALKRIDPEQSMGLVRFLGLFLQNTLSDYGHALREGRLSRNLVDIPLFRLMQFWGAYRGFRRQKAVTERLKRTFYYPRGSAGRRAAGSVPAEEGRRRIDYDEGSGRDG
ncbi:MAG: glycosyltransferase family A protein [bacterium]